MAAAKRVKGSSALPHAGARKAPTRLKLGDGFGKAAKKLGDRLHQKRINRACENFLKDPNMAALKFQPVVGRNGYWKFRINTSLFALLRKEQDKDGVYFLAVDILDHDDY